MPVPKTSDVGKLVKFFRREKPHWKKSRRLAAALDTARRHGAHIKKPKK